MRSVLARYPSAVASLAWTPHAGGFSGARVWRGVSLFCLKAWPPGYPADRLAAVHRWMRTARERSAAVPAVVAALDGRTVVSHAGVVWDVTAWMPGAPIDVPASDHRLAAASATLAELHRAWAAGGVTHAPCPAVRRRLDVLGEYLAGPPSLNHRATEVLRTAVPAALAELRPVADRPVPTFPCLCDVWRDHVLFTGDRVTGVIDYGAMKVDHPGVDLARWLGDVAGDDPRAWDVGLSAYRDAGGPVAVDADFTRLLDRTGVVCGVIHWLRRLAGDGPPADAGRLETLLARLERE